jgi:hypothetical protein
LPTEASLIGGRCPPYNYTSAVALSLSNPTKVGNARLFAVMYDRPKPRVDQQSNSALVVRASRVRFRRAGKIPARQGASPRDGRGVRPRAPVRTSQ